MKSALLLSTAMGLWAPLCAPAHAEQPAPQALRSAHRSGPSPGKLTASRSRELRALLDGLARQIAEINANIANLGSGDAAAVRFRTVSLATYRRAWAELTRDDADLEGEAVATLVGSRP
jgi:hypothetical protein